jgi:hypothetical protein
MTVSRRLAVMMAVRENKKPRAYRPGLLILPITTGFSRWLGCRDSNLNSLTVGQE